MIIIYLLLYISLFIYTSVPNHNRPLYGPRIDFNYWGISLYRGGGKNATEGKIQGDRAIQRLEDSISATVQLETRPEMPGNTNRIGTWFLSRCDLHSLEDSTGMECA